MARPGNARLGASAGAPLNTAPHTACNFPVEGNTMEYRDNAAYRADDGIARRAHRGTIRRAFLSAVAAFGLAAACLCAPSAAYAGGNSSGTVNPESQTPSATAALTDTNANPDPALAGKPVVDGSTDDAGGSTPVAGPVPNVIITNFSYGGASVAAGGRFDLAFTFQNMGRVAISNMVVTVDGGESFAIAGGTNTFYFDALWAGGALTQSVPMQAVSGAQSGAQPITVGFQYEYVDGGARNQNQSSITVSVPVSQPDRFEVNEPVLPENATSGEETTITLNYVNKGKGDISNVEATLEGEGFDAVTKTQYLGNIASGASGQIGYAFTPQAAGDMSATLKVSYENSDGQPQTKEFPITLPVADPMPVDMGAMDPTMGADGQTGVAWWVWVIAALVGVGLIVLIIVLVRRHRKKKAKAADFDEEWDEWGQGGDAAADAGQAAGAATATEPASDTAETQVISDMPSVTASPTSAPATGDKA